MIILKIYLYAWGFAVFGCGKSSYFINIFRKLIEGVSVITFAVSPGVTVREFDLTTTVPAVAATPAAFAGLFRWGPMQERVLLGTQDDLVKRFFKPSNLNGETWFSAFSYLAYGSQLWVVRAGDSTGNAVIQSYTGGSNGFTNGNNVILLNNTQLITVGQKLFFSNNAALSNTQNGGIYVNSVNSTSVTLSAAPTANVGSTQVGFRDNINYTAVAQQVVATNLEWADFNVTNAYTYGLLANTFDPSILYVARYPGAIGNSLRIAVCDTAAQFSSNLTLLPNAQINATATYIQANVGSNSVLVQITPASTSSAPNVTAANNLAGQIWTAISLGDQIQLGNTVTGIEVLKVSAISAIQNVSNVFSFTLSMFNSWNEWANTTLTNVQRYWEFYNLLGTAPGQTQYVYNFGNTAAQDAMHIVVVDNDGAFTGSPGIVLETYKSVSRATDAVNLNNTTNYYANVINQQSSYIWWANDRTGAASANAAQVASSTATMPLDMNLQYGDDGLPEGTVSMGTIINTGYNYFESPEDVDIGLILTGKALGQPVNANTQLATWLINNIATVRKDCVVFCSPDIADVVNNQGEEANAIVAARNTMPSTSFAFMDSGYKSMYDPFNNLYRWVPLNGDMAGLAAQCDHTNAPWWSFGGFNRGNVKNVVQLAWNPKEPDRDILYSNQVNPVVTFKDLGTVLYGDKTMFAEPSAFSRINVRRLFIVLEKSIAKASQFFLFEFNDSFTRSQFVSMVTPFLQNVQSLRGITAFKVRCDATNNTPYIIQNNQFVADIFIQPNYSINWVKLNFVAVPPTISFDEAESIQF